MKVLLAVDGSDYTRRMLDYVAKQGELLGPSHDYLLCTVVTPIPPHATHFLDRATVDDYYREQAQKVLQPLQRFAEQQGWRVRTMHVAGHAADAIAKVAAKENADLIVMGTHGHSALGNVLLGSVAAGVIARTACPVLLVR